MNFLDSSPSPQEELSPPDEVVDQPILVPHYSSSANSSTQERTQDMPPPTSCSAAHPPLRNTAVDSIDYRRLWMSNDIPAVVTIIETGQLLRGNEMFMEVFALRPVDRRLFHFSSMKELTSLSLFDVIVVNDLSLFWRWVWRMSLMPSEYSQLVNCNRQIIRSFIATVTNPAQGVSIPCILTMGPSWTTKATCSWSPSSFTPLKVDERAWGRNLRRPHWRERCFSGEDYIVLLVAWAVCSDSSFFKSLALVSSCGSNMLWILTT